MPYNPDYLLQSKLNYGAVCIDWRLFAVGVLMQYLLFGTLPEGYVETESIFMSLAAVGSSLMAPGC